MGWGHLELALEIVRGKPWRLRRLRGLSQRRSFNESLEFLGKIDVAFGGLDLNIPVASFNQLTSFLIRAVRRVAPEPDASGQIEAFNEVWQESPFRKATVCRDFTARTSCETRGGNQAARLGPGHVERSPAIEKDQS